MGRKRPGNFLDFVPKIHPGSVWSQEGGRVTIHMEHRGIWAAAARVLASTPRVSHIRLDEYGSFLWKQIDGTRTVGDLALEMKAQFGDGAEPLYNRLVKYMQILRNNRFILFRGKDKGAS